jgi:hypothetical protein
MSTGALAVVSAPSSFYISSTLSNIGAGGDLLVDIEPQTSLAATGSPHTETITIKDTANGSSVDLDVSFTLYPATATGLRDFINDPDSGSSINITLPSTTPPFSMNMDGTVNITKNVTIRLDSGATNSATINRGSAAGALFTVGTGGTLTLIGKPLGAFDYLILDGGSTSVTAPLIRVSGGRLVMGDNAVLKNNNSSTDGGAVYVAGGFFDMNGGFIGDNQANYGGGVYVDSSSSFTMTGGNITNNNAASYGGGVFVDGSFTMNTPAVAGTGVGGSITGNTAGLPSAPEQIFINGSTTITGTAITVGVNDNGW